MKDQRRINTWRKYNESHREQVRERNRIWMRNNRKPMDDTQRLANNARTRAKYAMKKAGVIKECQKCQIKSGRIDVHHIDSNPLNNNLSNLVYLCAKCHLGIGGVHFSN